MKFEKSNWLFRNVDEIQRFNAACEQFEKLDEGDFVGRIFISAVKSRDRYDFEYYGGFACITTLEPNGIGDIILRGTVYVVGKYHVLKIYYRMNINDFEDGNYDLEEVI